jgi:thiol-disulfide isomerase/thioredoxin
MCASSPLFTAIASDKPPVGSPRPFGLLLLTFWGLCGCTSTGERSPWQMPKAVAPSSQAASPRPQYKLPTGELPDAKKRLFYNGWYSEHADALAVAQKRNLAVLVDFHADWCLPCERMARQTFRDPLLWAEMQQRVVPLRIDLSEETQIGRQVLERYRVHALPCVLIVNKSGEPLKRFDKFIAAKELLFHIQQLPSQNNEGLVTKSRPAAGSEEPIPNPHTKPKR